MDNREKYNILNWRHPYLRQYQVLSFSDRDADLKKKEKKDLHSGGATLTRATYKVDLTQL